MLDKDGKALALTDKGGGRYTFVMPAGKITVKAVFMDDNTMLNFFTDVHAEDYYYDAVLWAAQKGITGGMSDTLFASRTLPAPERRSSLSCGTDCHVPVQNVRQQISKSTDGKRRQGNTLAAVCLPILCAISRFGASCIPGQTAAIRAGKSGKMSYFR